MLFVTCSKYELTKKNLLFSVFLQDEVHVDVDIKKASLYRIIYRYVNPGAHPVTAEVTVTPEASSEVKQTSGVTFPPSNAPHHVTVSSSRDVISTFVLNPGRWTVVLKTSGRVFVV